MLTAVRFSGILMLWAVGHIELRQAAGLRAVGGHCHSHGKDQDHEFAQWMHVSILGWEGDNGQPGTG